MDHTFFQFTTRNPRNLSRLTPQQNETLNIVGATTLPYRLNTNRLFERRSSCSCALISELTEYATEVRKNPLVPPAFKAALYTLPHGGCIPHLSSCNHVSLSLVGRSVLLNATTTETLSPPTHMASAGNPSRRLRLIPDLPQCLGQVRHDVPMPPADRHSVEYNFRPPHHTGDCFVVRRISRIYLCTQVCSLIRRKCADEWSEAIVSKPSFLWSAFPGHSAGS